MTHGARCGRDPRLQHVRAVPPPREAHPAVRHQRHRRPAAAALRRRPPAARLAVRVRPRRGHRSRAAPRRTGETYNVAGGVEMANRDTVRSPARAPRQAVVAGPPRRGPARARPALRDGRLQARGARLARADDLRGRAGPHDRLVRRQRAVVAGRPIRATGTPTTSASTASGCGPRPDARRGHGLDRPARVGPGRRPRRGAVHRPARARSPGPGRSSTSTRPTAWPRALDRDRPEVVVHAAAWTDVDGCAREPELAHAPQRRRDRRARRGLRGTRDRPADRLDRTRSSPAIATIGVGYAPDRPDRAPERVRPLQARRRAGGDRGLRRGRAGPASLGIARTAWLFGPPGRDFPHKILDAAAKALADGRAAAGRRRRVGHARRYAADVADAIVELLGARRARAASTTSSTAGSRTRATWARGRPGPARRAARPSSTVPATTWARASVPPRWGVLAADAAPGRRAAAVLARGDGRLRAGPRARRAQRRPRRPPPRRADADDRPRPTAVPPRGRPLRRDRPVRGPARLLPRDLARGHVRPDRSGRGRRAPRLRGPLRPGQPLRPRPRGVLRGLHLHQRQLDHWVVASGRAFVALVDVRPMLRGEADRPLVETRELAADEWVDIPIGVAHGFLALEPLRAHLSRDERVRRERRARLRLGRSAGRRAVAGRPARRPDGRPILSDRDRSNPSLTELVGRLRTSA